MVIHHYGPRGVISVDVDRKDVPVVIAYADRPDCLWDTGWQQAGEFGLGLYAPIRLPLPERIEAEEEEEPIA